MKLLFVIIIFAFDLYSPLHQNPVVIPQDEYYLTSKEKIRYALFNFDINRDKYIGFDKNDKPAGLSNLDLIKIERLIDKKIKRHNKETNKVYGNDWIIKSPEKYFKQFIAVINQKGEKEVWANCLCEVQTNSWKKYIPVVSDGGTCYFQLKINLTKGIVTSFGVNGLA